MLKLEPMNFIDLRLMTEALTAAMSVLDPTANPDEVFKICKAQKNIRQVITAMEAGKQAFSDALPNNTRHSDFLLAFAQEQKQEAINSILDPECILAAQKELITQVYKPPSF